MKYRKATILFWGIIMVLAGVTLMFYFRVKIFEPLLIEIRHAPENTVTGLIGITPTGKSIIYEDLTKNGIFKVEDGYFSSMRLRFTARSLSDSIQVSVNRCTYSLSQMIPSKTKAGDGDASATHEYEIPYRTSSDHFKKIIYLLKNTSPFLPAAAFVVLCALIIMLLKKKGFLQYLHYFFLSFLMIWCLMWLITGAFYCFPNGEEIYFTAYARNLGGLPSVIQKMISIEGRFFSNLLYAYNPYSFWGLAGYRMIPVITVLLGISSLWYFFIVLFRDAIARRKLLAAAILLTLSHFVLVHSIYQGLYWAYANFVYLFPWFFTLLWISFLVTYQRTTLIINKALYFLCCIVFLVAAAGLNEMFLVLNGVLLGGFLIRATVRKRGELTELIPVLLIGFGCIAFFVFSPGIQFRFSTLGNVERESSYLGNVFIMSISHFGHSFSSWSFGNGLIIPITIYLGFSFSGFLASSAFQRINKRTLAIITIAFIILLYLMTWSYYYPMGSHQYFPDRIFNSVMFGFLLLIVPVSMIIADFSKRLQQFAVFIKPLCLFIALFFVLFCDNNINLLNSDFQTGLLKAYRKQTRERTGIISSAIKTEGFRQAVIPEITAKPASVYPPGDLCQIKPDREFRIFNLGYEHHFQLDEIRYSSDTLYKIDEYMKILQRDLDMIKQKLKQ